MSSQAEEYDESARWLERIIDQSVFAPIRQGSAVAETVARLGQAIAAGLLRPGDRLPSEVRLADTLGISAVTLRSALTILRQGGLLETRRGRGGGTFVSFPTANGAELRDSTTVPPAEEVRDLIDFRCVVEGGAAGLAAESRTEEHLEEMRRQIDLMDAAEDFYAWSAADTLFHVVLADASGCSRLVSTVAELRVEAVSIGGIHQPVPVETMSHSNLQHRGILKAVQTHRPERARELTVLHIQSTYGLWVGLIPGIAAQAQSGLPTGAGPLAEGGSLTAITTGGGAERSGDPARPAH